MQDLTKGSITGHIVNMAVFIGVGLIFQTAYFLVDLFFVSRIGSFAIAGVSASGVTTFLVMGATQMIGVGGMALIAQAVGRKDQVDANIVSDQTLSISVFFALLTLVLGYAFGPAAVSSIAADERTAAAARDYLHGYLPALALMFPTAALGTALRASGVVQPTMLLQTGAVILNAVLAPVLIAGWGTGMPLGTFGAGLASSIAAGVAFVVLWIIFPRVQSFIQLKVSDLAPRFKDWGRIIGVGLPAAGEFFLMFIIFGVIYYVIRDFGPHAQAGFGVGMRIMQSIFLPAMAVAFAAAPIVGQNFGAGRADRIRETFRQSAIISSVIMFALTLFAHWRPDLLLKPFITDDPAALDIAIRYLQIASWNFVASGIIFTCSSMFQGLGDTRPSLFASGMRVFTFAIPAIWMSHQPGMTLDQIWLLSVASVFLQALVAFLLVRRQLKKKLAHLPATAPEPAAA